MNPRTQTCLWLLTSALLLSTAGCKDDRSNTVVQKTLPEPTVEIAISPQLQDDILGGAPSANLRQAARFAWEQFIALSWPAMMQTGAQYTRDYADANLLLSDPTYTGPLVWHTFRSKSEIFPGTGNPHGFSRGASQDYGYDDLPQYVFTPTDVGNYPGLPTGQAPACDASAPVPTVPPWLNLAENNQIGLDQMYAGAAPSGGSGQKLLFLAKANRAQYVYIASNGWFDGLATGSTLPAAATKQYLATRFMDPPAGSSTYFSAPIGTIEVKASWRELTRAEQDSGRFYMTLGRSYQAQNPSQRYGANASNPAGVQGNAGNPCYVDSVYGLVGFHLMQKTMSAPYFIFATFEQSDNILRADGTPVEDTEGRALGPQATDPTEPAIASRNATSANPATPDSIQALSPVAATTVPGNRLYYQTTADSPTPQGTIAVNRRTHAIPAPVVEINQAAHDSIADYNRDNNISRSPWQYYKLISVQWQPADKPVPGQDVVDDPSNPVEILRYAGVYYQANITVETNYNLQVFSGGFQPSPLAAPNAGTNVAGLITDFNLDGTVFKNVQYDANMPDGNTPGYNMGGCMGCHGVAQYNGAGFSFISLKGRVTAPDF